MQIQCRFSANLCWWGLDPNNTFLGSHVLGSSTIGRPTRPDFQFGGSSLELYGYVLLLVKFIFCAEDFLYIDHSLQRLPDLPLWCGCGGCEGVDLADIWALWYPTGSSGHRLNIPNLGAGPAKKCYFVSRAIYVVNIDSLSISKMLLKMLVAISS